MRTDDIRVWGKNGWAFLHAISFTYSMTPTATEKQRYQAFFDALQHVLPCPLCRAHYAAQFKRRPSTTFASRETLSRWLVDIHNAVNRTRGQTEYTYEEALALHGMGPSPDPSWAWLVVAALTVVLVVWFFSAQ